MAGFFTRGRMGGMMVSLGTPEDQPRWTTYLCPGCKTPIPFGTEEKAPPDNCPKCRRRLYIPTVMSLARLEQLREKQKLTIQPEQLAEWPRSEVKKPMRIRWSRIAFAVACAAAAMVLAGFFLAQLPTQTRVLVFQVFAFAGIIIPLIRRWPRRLNVRYLLIITMIVAVELALVAWLAKGL